MCSVLLLHGVLADAPIAVYFVRDEALDRGGSPPRRDEADPAVLAPRDPRAGGTWFGASERGLLAGLVNRLEDPAPAPARSRGLLLREVLSVDGAEAAIAAAVAAACREPHGGCRLFAAGASALLWVDLPAAGEPQEPGVISAGSWLLRHTGPPRPAPSVLRPAPGADFASWLAAVHPLIAGHEPSQDPLCVHGPEHGSVDTIAAALDARGALASFRYGSGSPCRAGALREYAGGGRLEDRA